MQLFLRLVGLLILLLACFSQREARAIYFESIPTLTYIGTTSGSTPPCTEIRTPSKKYRAIRCPYSASQDYYFFADFIYPMWTDSATLNVEPIVKTGSTDTTKNICTGIRGSVVMPTGIYHQNDGLGGTETTMLPSIGAIPVSAMAQVDLRGQEGLTIWDKTTGANCTVSNCAGKLVTLRLRRISEANGCTNNVPTDVDYVGVRIWYTRPNP